MVEAGHSISGTFEDIRQLSPQLRDLADRRAPDRLFIYFSILVDDEVAHADRSMSIRNFVNRRGILISSLAQRFARLDEQVFRGKMELSIA